MPAVDREGKFKVAEGACVSVEESTKEGSQSVALVFDFVATDYYDDIEHEWIDWTPYDAHIIAKLWIIKADGTPNERAVETARDVLGWDCSFDPIKRGDFETPAVQVSVEANEYKGRITYDGQWINPIDYVGRNQSANPEAIDKIAKMHGAKLRAFGGVGSVKKPIGKPVAPSTPRPSTSAPPSAPKGAATKEDAWGEFVKLIDDRNDEQYISEEWARIAAELFPSKNDDEMTPADWHRMATEGASMAIVAPF